MIKQRMAFVQFGERLEQSLAHVGQDCGRSLAPTHYLRFIEIDGNDFGEGAAEVDE